jgi:hypothetical protein
MRLDVNSHRKQSVNIDNLGVLSSHFPSRSEKYDSRSVHRRRINQEAKSIRAACIRSQYQHSARLASNKPIINVKMVRAADKYYNFPANQRLCARASGRESEARESVCVCERLLSESIFIIGTFLSLFINKIRI